MTTSSIVTGCNARANLPCDEGAFPRSSAQAARAHAMDADSRGPPTGHLVPGLLLQEA